MFPFFINSAALSTTSFGRQYTGFCVITSLQFIMEFSFKVVKISLGALAQVANQKQYEQNDDNSVYHWDSPSGYGAGEAVCG
jgi:hypothetical protein